MRRFSEGYNSEARVVVQEVSPGDRRLAEKLRIESENKKYAMISFFMAMLMGSLPLASYVTSRNVPSERIAEEFIFTRENQTGLTVGCPLPHEWANSSLMIAACQMVSDYCANTTFLNNTFQFLLNLSEFCTTGLRQDRQFDECLNESDASFEGECVYTGRQGFQITSIALPLVVAAVFVGFGVLYLMRNRQAANSTEQQLGNANLSSESLLVHVGREERPSPLASQNGSEGRFTQNGSNLGSPFLSHRGVITREEGDERTPLVETGSPRYYAGRLGF